MLEKDSDYQICFGDSIHLQIPTSNPILLKAILLCLFNNRLLNHHEVAKVLRLSEDRVGKLAKNLAEKDVTGLLDQRRGQQQDYVFTPTVKGELVQQFVIDMVQDGKMSGEGLSKHLKERCQYDLSPRSILYHLRNMGLSNIKSTLPALLEKAKKNFNILRKEINPEKINTQIGDADRARRPRLWMRLSIMVLLMIEPDQERSRKSWKKRAKESSPFSVNSKLFQVMHAGLSVRPASTLKIILSCWGKILRSVGPVFIVCLARMP